MPEQRRRSLAERLRRYFSSAAELAADDEAERPKDWGAVPLAECTRRSIVRLKGTIQSVRVNDAGWLEAELVDRTGSVRLVWMGRRRLECMAPGTSMVVGGRLTQEDGRPVIYNPEFEVVPG